MAKKKKSGKVSKGDQTIIETVHSRSNPYTMTNNRLARDWRMHFSTRGLLVMLLSLPDDWDIRMSTLRLASPLGRDGLRTVIKEAVRYGYMHRKRTTGGQHGQFKWVLQVYEDPDDNPHFDPDADPTLDAQPEHGFFPVSASTEIPSMSASTGIPSMSASTGIPSMSASTGIPSIYIYLYEMGRNTKKDKHEKHDDDGSPNPFSFSVKENGQAFAREYRGLVQIFAGWCAAMAIDWLPEWNGGERFPERLNDEQVSVLALWLWSWIRLHEDPHSMDRYEFIQRNGDIFQDIKNPVGKIVRQVERGNVPPLTEGDAEACAAAALRWSDAAATLLGAEDDTGVPW